MARDCPTKSNSDVKCYRCGVNGHMARDCASEPEH